MILAAAVGGEPVTRVLTWLQRPDGEPGLPDPARILREHGYDAVAHDVESSRDLVAETRDGVYAGARSGVRWLRNPQFTRWVTPPAAGGVEFRPDDFVRSTQTVYLLSKDGPGSARALIGSITAALYEAGRDLAEASGERVPTPVLFMLDEAANIIRWGELPSLFSYSGSLGLILVVILQSRAQGIKCWGKEGFTELWSAANVVFAGRGINDDEHLVALAQLVGDRQRRDKSVNVGTGQRSTSTSLKDERILTEADLRALPRGRGVLLVSGTRPILADLVDFSRRRDAPRIEASIQAFRQPWMRTADDGDQAEAGGGVVAGQVVS
jgi:type IV secretory pathway TraG/TraD family ATPase VirD4